MSSRSNKLHYRFWSYFSKCFVGFYQAGLCLGLGCYFLQAILFLFSIPLRSPFLFPNSLRFKIIYQFYIKFCRLSYSIRAHENFEAHHRALAFSLSLSLSPNLHLLPPPFPFSQYLIYLFILD